MTEHAPASDTEREPHAGAPESSATGNPEAVEGGSNACARAPAREGAELSGDKPDETGAPPELSGDPEQDFPVTQGKRQRLRRALEKHGFDLRLPGYHDPIPSMAERVDFADNAPWAPRKGPARTLGGVVARFLVLPNWLLRVALLNLTPARLLVAAAFAAVASQVPYAAALIKLALMALAAPFVGLWWLLSL